MFVDLSQYSEAYREIKRHSLVAPETCSVMLLVGTDVDGLCASEMFADMLQTDFISYKLVPLASTDDVITVRESIHEDEISVVVMFNTGATMDVLSEFDALEDGINANVSFFICDSHRPVHLANCYEKDRVYVLDDGETRELVPEEEDMFPVDDLDSDLEDSDPESSPSKRRRTDAGREDRAERYSEKLRRRREADSRRADYYSEAFYGTAASMLIWQMVNSSPTGKANNNNLWLASLGLTEQLLRDKIEMHKYLTDASVLQKAVSSINPLESEQVDQGSQLKINCDPDFKFDLLRHWTLFDSMCYSRFVASRLGTWRKRGKDRLKEMFALMGVSLDTCEQNYIAMDSDVKGILQSQLEECAGKFDMQDWSFPSFFSQLGYRPRISVCDHVQAINALLCSAGDEEDGWQRGFYRAYDAIKLQNHEEIEHGVKLAKTQHKAIFTQLEALVETRAVRKNRGFRYAILKNQPNQSMFFNPVMLSTLGYYLLDTFRFEKMAKKRTMPLILAALNEDKGTYLVVGIWANKARTCRNPFGSVFANATQHNVRFKYPGFDTTVLEVQAEDISYFVSKVAITLDETFQ